MIKCLKSAGGSLSKIKTNKKKYSEFVNGDFI